MSKYLLKENHDKGISIGVVGGGQLAQMLVQAAKKRGIEISVQTTSNNDPAAKYANKVILYGPESIEGTAVLAKSCNLITFENEWVNIDSLSSLENEGVQFLPSLDSISFLVDKISQRNLLKKLDIPVSEWQTLPKNAINDFLKPLDWDFPLMAKRSKGGYDGKGTKVIRSNKELIDFLNLIEDSDWFFEKWVNYEKELSLVLTRDLEGNIRSFPLVETHQSNQVCDWVIAPADVSHPVEIMAYNLASSLLIELNYVGVLTIEFFYGEDGLIINEIAPRTHNSAHYSIEACNTSQFDQQLCIASHLPLSDPKLLSPGAIMINLLGLPESSNLSLEKRISDINNIEGASLHWYEKELESPGRKVGHVTFLLKEQKNEDRLVEAKSILKKIRSIWPLYSAN